MKRFFHWLSPPAFDDKRKTLTAGYLHSIVLTLVGIGLLIGLINAWHGFAGTFWRVLGASLFMALVYALNRRGHVTAASYLLLGISIILITLELITDEGIHDRAIVLYPLSIVVASLLLQRKGVILMTIAVILSILLVVLGEMYGLFPEIRDNLLRHGTHLADAVLLSLLILIGAVITSMLSKSLLDMLNETRRNEAALAQANQFLVHQAELLRSSEMRWRSLIETAPNMILSLGRDGTILFNNKLRYQDRLVGKKVFDFIPAEQAEVAQQIIDRVFDTGERAYYEGIIRFDGDRWHSVSVGPVRDVNGQVISLTVVASDIDEYRKVVESLNASQELIQQRAAQLAVLNQIGREVSKLSDLQTTLKSILAQVRSVLPLDVFYVALLDSSKMALTFPILYDSGKLWDEPAMPIPPGSWLESVVRSRQPALINRTQEEMQQAQPATMLGDRTKKSASILIAPLLAGEKLIGIVSAQSYTLNHYTQEHLDLLTGVSYPTAIAIENARLYEALQVELEERRRIEWEVRQLNVELEQREVERTAELQNANQELEAFTYSISHDLRAPLRTIDGYAHILSEDLRNELGEDARLYLQRIHEGVDRMSHLIDDLLLFSRTSRQPLNVKRITSAELSQMVREVVALVQASEPGRSVDWRIMDLPGCQADASLLRQVFVNLIENAFKYTRQQKQAWVMVSGEPHDNGNVYCVRDNGVGFDMKYATKLFGVFQRLHLPEEYEGTGVGLAIVQRIIQRHGGKVWAESQAGQGAAFFFTLSRDG